MKSLLLLALACALLAVGHASIDQSPQKVGPKYFFGGLDGPNSNLESQLPSTTEKPASNEVEPEVEQPMTVRRVILMPAFTRTLISSTGHGDEDSSHDDFHRFMRPSSLMPLLFPQHFMRDFRPISSSPISEEPLVGAPSTAVNREREDTTLAAQPNNPIDLLLDMMTKALRSHAMVPLSGQPDDSNSTDKSLDKPAPKTVDETQEEVVTINGRKYLKKSIVSRHFGDNLMFLTRRLVFTPLDEVEGAPNTTTITNEPKSAPTTEAPVSTTQQAKQSTTDSSTKQAEDTTPAAKIQPSSTTDKLIEAELIKPAVSTPDSPTSEKPLVEAASFKPIPSSEPDFVRV